MTVIAGIRTDEGVILGADTGMTGEFGRKGAGISLVCNMHIDKLTSLRLDGGEEFIWGAAGLWFPCQVLQKFWRPGPPIEDTEGFIWNAVQEAFKILYDSHGERRKVFEDEDYEDAVGIEMLVGFRGELWGITGEGCVDRVVDDCAAIGSASLVAFGALFATAGASDMTPKQRLTTALDAAVHTSTEIRPPYTFVTAQHETE